MSLRAGAFLLAISFPVGANAAIFQSDDRILVAPRKGDPLAIIGQVSGPAHIGTGFLISECLVLTVRHVLDDDPIGRKLTFTVTIGGRKRLKSRAISIAAGDLNENNLLATGRSQDWMLLRLHKCLGRILGFGYLGVQDQSDLDGDNWRVSSAGFPEDRPTADALVVDPSCRLRDASTYEWYHDCATLSGNSGSPIFRIGTVDGQRRLRIVGLVTCGPHERAVQDYRVETANRATRIDFLAAMLAPYISSASGKRGVDEPRLPL